MFSFCCIETDRSSWQQSPRQRWPLRSTHGARARRSSWGAGSGSSPACACAGLTRLGGDDLGFGADRTSSGPSPCQTPRREPVGTASLAGAPHPSPRPQRAGPPRNRTARRGPLVTVVTLVTTVTVVVRACREGGSDELKCHPCPGRAGCRRGPRTSPRLERRPARAERSELPMMTQCV